jgi:hypothetical protein
MNNEVDKNIKTDRILSGLICSNDEDGKIM